MVAEKENQQNELRPEKSMFNIANALTVLRILMVPLFVAAFMADDREYGGWRWIALAIFCLAIYTDLLDGDLARSRNIITNFGRIADPMADKVLIGSALILLSFADELPWAVTCVILGRESAVTILRFAVIKRGIIAASRGGKIKTFTQTVAIFLYLLPWTVAGRSVFFTCVAAVVMALAVVFSVVTGCLYGLSAWRLVHSKDEAPLHGELRNNNFSHFKEQPAEVGSKVEGV